MLSSEDIGLIEPYDEMPPQHCRLEIAIYGDRAELPIPQPSLSAILLMTLGLAVVATPFCLFVFNTLKDSPTVGSGLGWGILTGSIWVLAVLGPVSFWFFWPVGALRPDHWLRFDRNSGLLSIRGGSSIFRREEVVCLLAVTDRRPKKRQTEFQVITGLPSACVKHFVVHCRVLDPKEAFGASIEAIGRFSGIPFCYAIIDCEGKITIEDAAAKPVKTSIN